MLAGALLGRFCSFTVHMTSHMLLAFTKECAMKPKPIDRVRTRREAIVCWSENPTRVCLTLAECELPMLPPWQPRMQLDGAVLYVHPENEREATVRS